MSDARRYIVQTRPSQRLKPNCTVAVDVYQRNRAGTYWIAPDSFAINIQAVPAVLQALQKILDCAAQQNVLVAPDDQGALSVYGSAPAADLPEVRS